MYSLTLKDFIVMEAGTETEGVKTWEQGVAYLGGFVGERPHAKIDTQDIIELFDIMQSAFHDTAELLGKSKKATYTSATKTYKNIPFNYVDDVHKAVEAYYKGEHMPKGSLRTWQLLDRYIVQPFLAKFKGASHQNAISAIDQIIDHAKKYTLGPGDMDFEIDPREPRIGFEIGDPNAPDPDDPSYQEPVSTRRPMYDPEWDLDPDDDTGPSPLPAAPMVPRHVPISAPRPAPRVAPTVPSSSVAPRKPMSGSLMSRLNKYLGR